MSLFQKKLIESDLPQSSQMNRKQIEAIAGSFTRALLSTYDANLADFTQKGLKDAEAQAYIKTMNEVYGYSSELAQKSGLKK